LHPNTLVPEVLLSKLPELVMGLELFVQFADVGEIRLGEAEQGFAAVAGLCCCFCVVELR